MEMKISWVLLAFLLCCRTSEAADGAKVHVMPLSPGFDTKEFVGDHEVVEDEPGDEAVPTIEVRERIFAAAGLAREVADLDQFDRDELFRHAKYQSADELHRRYSQISAVNLEHLRKLVTEWARAHSR